ncbi:hypothetical protein BC835DRAFT_972859 [Cytidiella melzeri]|nr:hypothetical protein BC835DRAFT_972859 [Cytidiella melzeri]
MFIRLRRCSVWLPLVQGLVLIDNPTSIQLRSGELHIVCLERLIEVRGTRGCPWNQVAGIQGQLQDRGTTKLNSTARRPWTGADWPISLLHFQDLDGTICV